VENEARLLQEPKKEHDLDAQQQVFHDDFQLVTSKKQKKLASRI